MTNQMNSKPELINSQLVQKSIQINASPARVWSALTDPILIKEWMRAESEIEIITDWQVGAPIVIRGELHGIDFENRGTVLHFEPEQRLQYTQLSSLSNLPDVPENYTVLEFKVAPIHQQTTLTLTVRNFPTEVIYKHLAFYWNVALEIFKKVIEQ